MIALGFLKDSNRKAPKLHQNYVLGNENLSNYFNSFRSSPVKSPQLESIEQRILKMEKTQFETCYEMLLRKKVDELT